MFVQNVKRTESTARRKEEKRRLAAIAERCAQATASTLLSVEPSTEHYAAPKQHCLVHRTGETSLINNGNRLDTDNRYTHTSLSKKGNFERLYFS